MGSGFLKIIDERPFLRKKPAPTILLKVKLPILYEVAQNSDPSREGWGLFDAALQRIGSAPLNSDLVSLPNYRPAKPLKAFFL